MKVWASRRFVVRLYRTSQVSLGRRFGQIRVSVNPRHIFGWTTSVFSQYQSGTSSSRGIILGQLTYIITAKLMLFLFRSILKASLIQLNLLGKGIIKTQRALILSQEKSMFRDVIEKSFVIAKASFVKYLRIN